MRLQPQINRLVQSLDQVLARGTVVYADIIGIFQRKLTRRVVSSAHFWPAFSRAIVKQVGAVAPPAHTSSHQVDHLDTLGMWLSWVVGTTIGRPVPGPALFYSCIRPFMTECDYGQEANQRMLTNMCLFIVAIVNQVCSFGCIQVCASCASCVSVTLQSWLYCNNFLLQ